jgi:hypothetical protein
MRAEAAELMRETVRVLREAGEPLPAARSPRA